MYTLEPLCDLEQSILLKELKFNEVTSYAFVHDEDASCLDTDINNHFELIKDEGSNEDEDFICCPTISMARNWIWEKYKLWMETSKKPFLIKMYSASYYLQNGETIKAQNVNPHTAESQCLTQILKHLKNKANASKHV